MVDKKENQNIIDRIWSLFSSVTLAVINFSAISLTSIVGTIIEQQAEPERNIKLLSKFFGDSAPTVYKMLDTLGFTDMFRSWWFITLLFIFAANLIICSIDRLPAIWKVAKEPIKPIPPDRFNSMPIKREIVLKMRLDNAKNIVEAGMKKIGFASNQHEENELQFYAEKGRYSRLGVYVTHFSIIIILIGAVAGIFLGFNGSLNLLEGTTSAVAYSFGTAKEIPLGFEIRCDDFDVSFYDNSDTPRAFRSKLAIIENGKEVLKKEIEVNTPLRYKGITFYQSSYNFSSNKDALFLFTMTPNNGKQEDIQFGFDEPFKISGTNVTGKVADFSPALGMDESGKLFTYANLMNNPAVFIEFSEGGKVVHKQWILKRYQETWKTPYGIAVFKDLWGVQATGLQVRKDPGVWIVYLGCLIMGIGLYAAFFMSHSRIWVRLVSDKNNTKVYFAASANKNKISLEQKIDKLIKSFGG
ncbi:MAG: cytochrome c biogenesis protein ResB [Thermodesulfovibrionales bacterium]|nr:cytochrome c biogenesis protein ResB [Thermodesulfovibrionales bacterium]